MPVLRTVALLALALVAVYSAPAKLSDSEYEFLFESFAQEHGKTYTAEERPNKLTVFKDK